MKKSQSNKIEQTLYIETARQRIAEVLFRYPNKEFSLSDLAIEAQVNKSNIGAILDDYHTSGFIEITKLSKIWRIKANQASWYFQRSKIVYNLDFVYRSGLVEFLVDHFKNPKAVVLFGTFRYGTDITTSDIDIAIESAEVENYEILSLKELGEFEKGIGKKIQIHLFNRHAVDISLFNNIANGFVLSGFLEVQK
ncbi:TPA: nucleotidyltransferase domain-containing protein [Candidatus Woesearchaeota archaeon]|nr:nucleotidyltransferase domain-containing protein [Candidatus Woesearchaeota archaeon]